MAVEIWNPRSPNPSDVKKLAEQMSVSLMNMSIEHAVTLAIRPGAFNGRLAADAQNAKEIDWKESMKDADDQLILVDGRHRMVALIDYITKSRQNELHNLDSQLSGINRIKSIDKEALQAARHAAFDAFKSKGIWLAKVYNLGALL